ncbi:GlxA family transcriptional regulator [Thalassolituus oleivorans]|uniref:GlxA family transcriptional regulator n=1 Tax=Thalassolituus oleivorans TaxID=187493 RepID=UPI00042DC8CA|nr:helix-turn-helix domain-containing protein [Thalassolituus oleivorans]AHK15709.1 AraC family transcriptional regulator [Thalassolituus oleivorans R6-15]
MTADAPIPLKHVTLLQLEAMLLSSIAMPLEMLEALRARLRLRTSTRRQANFVAEVGQYSVTGEQPQPLGGLVLEGQRSVLDIADTDVIIIPALWRQPEKYLTDAKPLLDWLITRFQQGATIVAIGSGVWLPAKAGLLNGLPATAHWHSLAAFTAMFPKVKWQHDHLLTQAGRIFCAASINSGADLIIHLIGLNYGRDLALQVEQQFSPEVRNPFEKRVFQADSAMQHADEAIALAQSWLHQNMNEVLSLPLLASLADLSVRQFSRRFVMVTGETPVRYQQRLRCMAARDWLQNSNLGLADIASQLGFSDASHFGRVFQRWAGVTPGVYRNQVRRKIFAVSPSSEIT